MPNNDLGTAHGRIKVTYEDKGSAAATASLIKMHKQFEAMNKSLGKIEAALNKNNATLGNAEKQIEKTGRAAKGMSRDVFDAHKSISKFSSDTRDLAKDLLTVYKYTERARKGFTVLSRTIKVLNSAGQYGSNDHRNIFRAMSIAMSDMLAQSNKTIRGVNTITQGFMRNIARHENSLVGLRSTVNLAAGGYIILRNKIFGVDQAIARSPRWVAQMNMFARSIGLVSLAALGLSKAFKPLEMIEKLGNTKVFNALIGKTERLGLSVEKFGRLSQRVFGRDFTKGLADGLKNSDRHMTVFLNKASLGAGKASGSFDRFSKLTKVLGTDTIRLASGMALLVSSLGSLWNRFQWFFKLPKPLMAGFAMFFSRVLPTALHYTSAALKGASNLVVGLWDGIKQLSGGFTILPGLIATFGSAISALFPVFIGLKDKFKDVFSDDYTKSWEAYWKLPAHLRPIADAIKKVIPAAKELQKAFQMEAFKGAGDQIEKIANTYFPLMEKNAIKVVTSIRNVKDEFVGFLLSAQTQSDVAKIYDNTAASIQNIAKSINPASQGMRDLSVAGSDFIRQMSSFAPYLSNQFRAWADANRQNGNMMRWMQDSVSGTYDLGRGLISATKAAYNLLAVFKTNNGEDFLERFANSMDKMNKKVQESSISGWLGDFKRGVQNMGAKKIDDVKNLFKILTETISSVIPFIKRISNAFSNTFIPSMQHALWVIDVFIQTLENLGVTRVGGWILGVATATRLLPKVFSTAIDSVKAFSGAFLVLTNKQKVINGFENAIISLGNKLKKMGGFAETAGAGLINVGASAGKAVTFISRLIGGLTMVGVALMAFFGIYEGHNEDLQKFNDQIKLNEDHINSYKKSLRDAFMVSRGAIDKGVLGQVSNGLNTMMSDLEATAGTAPGMMSHIWDKLKQGAAQGGLGLIISLFQGDSAQTNHMQQVAADAQKAADGFKILRDKGVDLAAVVAMNDTEFQKFINSQHALGGASAAAADELIRQRLNFKNLHQEALDAGPAALEVAEGINQIAEAGGDATAKLDGLKKVLEGLGLIQRTAGDALAEYEQGIDDLTSKVTSLMEAGATRSDLIDGTTFNYGTQAGRDFREALKSIADGFMAATSTGANAQTEYAKFESQLDSLSAQTKLSKEELIRLGQQVGLLPDVIPMTLQLDGKDNLTRDLFAIYAQMQQRVSAGINVGVVIPTQDAEAVEREIDQLLGKDATSVDGRSLYIKPDISQEDLNKIKAKLAELGVSDKPQASGAGPQAPATAAILPGVPTGEERNQIDKDWKDLFQVPKTEAENAADAARDSGSKFVEELARGMRDNRAAMDAAKDLAGGIKGWFHQSPPKYGPLAAHGDAAKYAGGKFVESYATGLTNAAGAAGQAAGNVAGAAGTGIAGDRNYQQGKFLGQISQLVDFVQHAVDAFTKLAETVFNAAKFASDPLGKGTFFGQSRKWRRDPNVSDQQLQLNRQLDRQQQLSNALANPQYDTKIDPTTGRVKGKAPGDLGPTPGKQDIANYIIDKAMSLGYSRNQANEFLTQAFGESGLSPTASNPAGWEGIFQFDAPTWKQAGGGDVRNAQQNIDNYFNLAAQRGLTPESFTQGSQLGTQVSSGGPWHPENQANGHLANAQAGVKQYIDAYQAQVGQTVDGIMSGIPAVIGNLPKSSKLNTGPGLEQSAYTVAALLEQAFPGITQIGGQENRPAGSPQMHTNGRALDVGVGSGPSAAALGDKIFAWAQANFDKFGIQSAIWKDVGHNFVANEAGGPGSTYSASGHGGPTGTDASAHVHIQFADGAKIDVAPDGTMNMKIPASSPLADSNFGLPPTPDQWAHPPAPKDQVVRNPDGTFSPVHSGDAAAPGNNEINWQTGKPWTPEESAAFWSAPENAPKFDVPMDIANDQSLTQQTQEQILNESVGQNALLQQILRNGTDNLTTSQAIEANTALQSLIDQQDPNTAMGAYRKQGLEGIQSDIGSKYGLSQEENPFDTATSIIGDFSSMAGDIFKVIGGAIDAVGSAKDIGDQLVRGVANTEDLYNMVDKIQTFIQLGSDIAGAVAGISGAISGIVGAAGSGDSSGGSQAAAAALGAVSSIAGIVQAAYDTVNAFIDLGQEAYRIIGSYAGQLLGFIAGGPEGLMGNVKFLLDEQSQELLAYSTDNPLDKRSHDMAWTTKDENARNQLIGNINVYGGPGSDPRDNTRQMMYQVRASSMMAATGQ